MVALEGKVWRELSSRLSNLILRSTMFASIIIEQSDERHGFEMQQ